MGCTEFRPSIIIIFLPLYFLRHISSNFSDFCSYLALDLLKNLAKQSFKKNRFQAIVGALLYACSLEWHRCNEKKWRKENHDLSFNNAFGIIRLPERRMILRFLRSKPPCRARSRASRFQKYWSTVMFSHASYDGNFFLLICGTCKILWCY